MASFISFGDPGLFDEFMQSLDVAAHETPLMRAGKAVNWAIFEPDLVGAVVQDAKGPGGRPRFHPLLMFKVLTGSMRALRQRCIGMERNDACIKLTDLVYNMLRFGQIQRLGIRYSRPAVA
jgi:hypothetical protein